MHGSSLEFLFLSTWGGCEFDYALFCSLGSGASWLEITRHYARCSMKYVAQTADLIRSDKDLIISRDKVNMLLVKHL